MLHVSYDTSVKRHVVCKIVRLVKCHIRIYSLIEFKFLKWRKHNFENKILWEFLFFNFK